MDLQFSTVFALFHQNRVKISKKKHKQPKYKPRPLNGGSSDFLNSLIISYFSKQISLLFLKSRQIHADFIRVKTVDLKLQF